MKIGLGLLGTNTATDDIPGPRDYWPSLVSPQDCECRKERRFFKGQSGRDSTCGVAPERALL